MILYPQSSGIFSGILQWQLVTMVHHQRTGLKGEVVSYVRLNNSSHPVVINWIVLYALSG